MNWLKIYFKIIDNAKIRNISKNSEYHHIIPKSVYNNNYSHIILNRGTIENLNDKENMVYLTPKEHYFCHLILIKILENNKDCYIKMCYAFSIMANRVMNGKMYEFMKLKVAKAFSNYMTGKPSKAKGCKWSEEAKKNKSLTSPSRGKTYEEIYGIDKAKELKLNRSLSRKGKVVSEETKQKLRKRIINEEWRYKLSIAKKGKKLSKETTEKIKRIMKNTILNPNVDQKFYYFYNTKTLKTICCRKIDAKCYGINQAIHLIRGDIKQYKDWVFIAPCYMSFGKNIKNMKLNPYFWKDFYDSINIGEYNVIYERI